jgi:hypothetical protein
MGIFGFGKKKDANGDGIYYGVNSHNDDLPVAVAVIPEDALYYPPPASTAPSQMEATTTTTRAPLSSEPTVSYISNNNRQQQPKTVTTNPNPDPLFFISRVPTVLPVCHSCQRRNGRTRIRTEPDLETWVAVVILFCVFWPLCWIPLVTDSCRKTTHYCSNCGAEVGSIPAFHDCCVKHR